MYSLDIFCDVIDNYGDAGVCLHLARTLSSSCKVRLFCNNMQVLGTLVTDSDRDSSTLSLVSWENPPQSYDPADAVISAFNCRFDSTVLSALQQHRSSLIINLDYLSAESWVEDCHKIPSFVDGLEVYYYFPGFTARTGGLNIDSTFRAQCLQRLQNAPLTSSSSPCPSQSGQQLQPPQLRPHTQLLLQPQSQAALWPSDAKEIARTITLFGYENDAVGAFIDACGRSRRRTEITVFAGLAQDNLRRLYGQNFAPGTITAVNDRVSITCSPMVTHEHYDQILLNHDFNLVRGEDSIVRAMHTGIPFLWHIYPQDEQAHITKLKSFLERMEQINLEIAGTFSHRDTRPGELHSAQSTGCPDSPLEHSPACAMNRSAFVSVSNEDVRKGMDLISSTMLAYNGGAPWDDSFDLDGFIACTAPLYHNFALYLCSQRSLTETLMDFINEKLASR